MTRHLCEAPEPLHPSHHVIDSINLSGGQFAVTNGGWLEVEMDYSGELPVGFNRGPWFGRMLSDKGMHLYSDSLLLYRTS